MMRLALALSGFLINWSKNQSVTIRKHLYYLRLCHILKFKY